MIILIGSAATVNVNMANGGPKAKKAQPKKSITVIFAEVYVVTSPLRSTWIFGASAQQRHQKSPKYY